MPRSAEAPRRSSMAARRGGSAVFASYNIHKCVGVDRRFDPERVMAVIGEIGADVIALQEADRRFGDRAGLLDLPRLANATTGLVPVPVTNGHRGHGWHGNVVLVREGAVQRPAPDCAAGPRAARRAGRRHRPRGRAGAGGGGASGAVPPLAAAAGRGAARACGRGHRAPGGADGRPQRMAPPPALGADRASSRASGRSAGVASFPAYFPVLALDRVLAQPPASSSGSRRTRAPLARQASDHLPVKAVIRLDGSEPGRGRPPRPGAAEAAAAGAASRRRQAGAMSALRVALAGRRWRPPALRRRAGGGAVSRADAEPTTAT